MQGRLQKKMLENQTGVLKCLQARKGAGFFAGLGAPDAHMALESLGGGGLEPEWAYMEAPSDDKVNSKLYVGFTAEVVDEAAMPLEAVKGLQLIYRSLIMYINVCFDTAAKYEGPQKKPTALEATADELTRVRKVWLEMKGAWEASVGWAAEWGPRCVLGATAAVCVLQRCGPVVAQVGEPRRPVRQVPSPSPPPRRSQVSGIVHVSGALVGHLLSTGKR